MIIILFFNLLSQLSPRVIEGNHYFPESSLKSSEIYAQSAQEGLVRSFLENGLRITRELLKQKTLVAD